jgi:hypothetical protein
VASLQECEAALRELAARIAAVDPELRRRHAVDRTVSCRVPDLAMVFHVRLSGGSVVDLHCRGEQDAAEPAQVRLAAASDDLVAIVTGTLTPPAAWATGRLTVEASVLDLCGCARCSDGRAPQRQAGARRPASVSAHVSAASARRASSPAPSTTT